MAQIVTITNPLTGQPTQVDQLDHTAQEIDDAIARALPGGAIDTDLALRAPLASPALTGTPTINGVAAANVGQLCNPNLLDNAYFVNPVDQRGGYVVPPGVTYWTAMVDGTSPGVTDKYYTAKVNSVRSDWYEFTKDGTVYYVSAVNVVRGYTGAGYTIDRWESYSNLAVIIEPDGITIRNDTDDTGYFGQTAEYDLWDALVGKTVTMSVLTGNGTLYFCTGTYGTNISFPVGDGVNAYMWPTSKEPFDFSIAAGVSIKLSAVKLELGSQQTLAHQENGVWVLNEIPDYGEQLARCQRYFQLYSSEDRRPAKAVDCRPTMRTDPAHGTVVVNGTTYYYNSADM